ncbi:MAG: P1 family peptidase [Pseudomonadota bacterium]
MARPGSRNLITDVDGIKVGSAEDHDARSGVTVVLPDARTTCAVDVRGGAPGTRETEALDPTCLVDAVDAVVLSGGSAFGLDAASGVMSWLAQAGRGFEVGGMTVPIVPAAILFDLLNGGDKSWVAEPPYRALGHRAAQNACESFDLGNAGAGLGASAGTLKGGLGSASAVSNDGLQVAALVAVNCVGSAVIPDTGTLWAWPFEQQREMGGQKPPTFDGDLALAEAMPGLPGENTTIGVVACNARLSKAQAERVAIMTHDGYARAIRPVHTPFDGDTVFSLATATWGPDAVESDLVMRIGGLAADCMTRAVGRAIWHAESLGDLKSYRDTHAGAD